MLLESGIVFFVDPRFPGGTTRAITAETTALMRAGYSAGLCPVMGPNFRIGRDFHPTLVTLLDQGALKWIDPAESGRTRLVIVHHHTLFTHLPQDPISLETDRLILVLHHPPFNGFGDSEYDLTTICANLSESFGINPELAPVGPAVRGQLRRLVLLPAKVLDEDWSNLIDLDAWLPVERAAVPGHVTIGRHSRPQLEKFPETLTEALLVYPERPDVAVRMLGTPPDLAAHYGRIPSNWEVLEFDEMEVSTFLESLDYFVYFHSSRWVEAFGYVILEAIAKGVPAILPPALRSLFGPAALYAEPQDVFSVVQTFSQDLEKRRQHITGARASIGARFGLDQFVMRLDRVVPGWRHRPIPAQAMRPLRCVMMTSNGVGIGHLTRLLAIARQLPADSQTAFFTLSQGFRLAEAAGYLTQFVPYHGATGASNQAWNTALAEELGDFLDLIRPDILVFDGGHPYAGLLAALDERRTIKRVWVSRALWASEAPEVSKRAAQFDLIIEPGELSARFDTIGRKAREKAIVVGPIVLHPVQPRSTRDAARAELGIPQDALAVGLMLGAGTNFDFRSIRNVILADLGSRGGIDITEFRQPIAGRTQSEARHRVVSRYPASTLTKAFDFMVTSAGYNSFHEAILHQIPTIFVPNEAGEMDRQILRARHARAIGCSEVLRASDRVRVKAVIERMLDPDVRREMQRRMRRLSLADGGVEAAALIHRTGRMLRMVSPI